MPQTDTKGLLGRLRRRIRIHGRSVITIHETKRISQILAELYIYVDILEPTTKTRRNSFGKIAFLSTMKQNRTKEWPKIQTQRPTRGLNSQPWA
jgi:hypothetical protein